MKKVALFILCLSLGCSTTDKVIFFPVQVNRPIEGKILIAPFLNESEESILWQRQINKEFENYLHSLLLRIRSPNLKVLPLPEVNFPSQDPLFLWRMKEFWQQLAAEKSADYVVTGSVSFEGPKYIVEGKKQISKPRAEIALTIVIFDKEGKLVRGEEIKFSLSDTSTNKSSSTSFFYDVNFPKEKILAIFVPIRLQVKRYIL